MLLLYLFLTLCLSKTTFHIYRDKSYLQYTCSRQDGRTLYKLSTSQFLVGHKFIVSNEFGQEIVKAKRFLRNPKAALFIPKYQVKYLSNGTWYPAVIKAKWLVDVRRWPTMDIIIGDETFTAKGGERILHLEVFSNRDKKVVADLDFGGLKLGRIMGSGIKSFVANVDETRIEPSLVALVFGIVERFRFINEDAFLDMPTLLTVSNRKIKNPFGE